MLGILLILFASFLVLDVSLFVMALSATLIPSFLGVALALVGPALWALIVIQFFFWVAPDLSDTVQLKTAYLACVVGCVAGIFGIFCIPDYFDLLRTKHGEAIEVSKARDHGGTGYRHYIKGRLRADLMVSHTVESTDSEGNQTHTRYSAVPVFPDRPQERLALGLFAVAIGEPPFEKWVDERRPIQGILQRMDRYHERTLKLARKTGWRIHSDVVLLRLDARTYDEMLTSKRSWSQLVVLGANGLWLIIALFWGRQRMAEIRRSRF